MYIQAIANTFYTMGPQYLTSIFRWVKAAVYDAPIRLLLDIELELQSMERALGNGGE